MEVAVIVAVVAVLGAVYKPVEESMVPDPVTVQVTAVHSGRPEFGLAELHVEVTALKGTPATVAKNGSVSPVPMVNVDGVTVTERPEISVTVADAVAEVFCTAAPTVIVVLGGMDDGAV